MIEATLISEPRPEAFSRAKPSRATRTTPSRLTSRIVDPVGVGQVAEVAAHVEAGVVDEHVEAAVRRLHRAEHGGHVLAARDVGGDRRAPPRRPLTISAGHRLGGGAVHVGDVDVRALGREQLRGGPADAGAGAGHQRDAALKTFHRSPSSSCGWALAAGWARRRATSRASSPAPRRCSGAGPRWRRSRPWWRPSCSAMAAICTISAASAPEHVAADHLVAVAVDQQLHEHELVAPRQRVLERPEARRVDVELGIALAAPRARAGRRCRSRAWRTRRSGSARGRRSSGLLPNTRVGEGVALADGDRRQVDAVGDVADGVDVLDRGARVRVDERPRRRSPSFTPAVSSPRPRVLGVRPVANITHCRPRASCRPSASRCSRDQFFSMAAIVGVARARRSRA